ncbi:glycosyltransferase [Francisella tularensis subsp. novicida]|uniref:glycosyltransferase family 2 protein n=1 Tax=Francisella tularensis TaxID=263 RepID=UPI000158AF09|nr:glycosyltransferase family 2 protein [Francisella tularensis]AJI46028.1 glycosyl transferase 2 family protein [Francisella tularensis subsp. novicida F6168]AJJ47068.1 glycosyltransferase like 2 family protein [Francisella tularensis subsp. novicida]APC98080.1 glycosyltransferase like 2 family protein [Francisella tularensis subsp. novicida]EDN36535.1 predicted protein [Francisella tularensis subsp. novicida GA99-3549]KFJ66643.1 glycosyl transferase 2 family protein [Francisella tularensis s
MSQTDQKIKFSVITVCYNSEKTIQKTLQSIKDQTYKNIEYIVIDGGSTDKTLEIISGYKDIVDILISEPDNGIYDAMNKGIKLATGDYIGFLNSDDYYKNDIFEIYASALKDKSNISYIYANVFVVSDNYIRTDFAISTIVNKVYQNMPLCHQSLYVDKTIAKQLAFDTNYKIVADLDFFNRLIKLNNNYIYINKEVCYFLAGGISSASVMSEFENRRVALNNGRNYILANLHFSYKLIRIYLYQLAGNTKIYNRIKKYFLKIKYKSKV